MEIYWRSNKHLLSNFPLLYRLLLWVHCVAHLVSNVCHFSCKSRAHVGSPSTVLFFSIFSWKQFGKTWPLFDVVGADRLWWPPLSFFSIRAISSSRGQGGESRNPPGPEASENHVTPPPPLPPHACFDGLGDCCSTSRKEKVNWKWKSFTHSDLHDFIFLC